MVEKWASIEGYGGAYEVSNLGAVRSKYIKGARGVLTDKTTIIKPRAERGNRYLTVCLYKNGNGTVKYVHRLVATAFVSNPNNKPTVNHIDLNKLNNRADNLEWATSAENNKHAFDNGALTNPRLPGELNPKAKLTTVEVNEIRRLSGSKSADLSIKYGVSQSTIQRIWAGKLWGLSGSVTHSRRGEGCGSSKLKECDVLEIKKRCAAGDKQKDIARDFNISDSNVGLIARGKTWKHVSCP
jgi:hypothetical protein